MAEDLVLILVMQSESFDPCKYSISIESQLHQVYQSGVLAVLCGLVHWKASVWDVRRTCVVGGE